VDIDLGGLMAALLSHASLASCVVIGSGYGLRRSLRKPLPGDRSRLLLLVQFLVHFRIWIPLPLRRRLLSVCSLRLTARLGLFAARFWQRCGLSTPESTPPRFGGSPHLAPRLLARRPCSPRSRTSTPLARYRSRLPAQSAPSPRLCRRRMGLMGQRVLLQVPPVLPDISLRLILMLC